MENQHLECPVCFRDNFNSSDALSNHVQTHFSDNETLAASSSARERNPGNQDRAPTIEEQLRERRNRISALRQPAAQSTSVKQKSQNSDQVLLDIDEFRMENDRQIALRLAREEEDLAFAKSLQEQDSVIIISDEEDATTSVNHHEDNFAASTSADSFASNSAMQMDVFQGKNADSGYTCTWGLISRISQILREDDRTETFLLADEFAHFASDPEDYGWSCGYRNAQMLISAMLSIPRCKEQWRARLGSCFVPSILYLQQLMQQAWNAGWDPQGNTEHRGEIIGSKNWLGPIDLYSMLMNLGIECQITFFVHATSREGPHPELFRWCQEHFANRSNRNVLPIYLQHAGHSRTIAGIEVMKNGGQNFIIFDPSTKKEKARNTTIGKGKWLGYHFRRSLSTVNKARYEVLHLTGNILTPAEIERCKQSSRSGVRGVRKVS
ncbi:zinc finger-containing ubiquitin peptidase 1-like [Paramacrobiotus metropolitanus]|uniref:zinc finger-containing ubiquitin peptidase 1-like n=1 Tax=Paramacrobiotus metropolitanus TaxID=2943436 RepID=UPI002445B4CA|nr:zinc finger-containing ubiquitin peptidase 1-like [Paramacrobiotus metropolitanus]